MITRAIVLMALIAVGCTEGPATEGSSVPHQAPTPDTTTGQVPPAIEPETTAVTNFTYEGRSGVVIRPDSAGLHQITTVNRSFHITKERTPTPILLEEIIETHCCTGGEINTWAEVVLRAWLNPTREPRSPSWSKKVAADGGDIYGEFYRARVYGCCDSGSYVEYINLRTGESVFYATRYWGDGEDPLFTVSVPNSSLRRFLAFHDRTTFVDPPEAENDSSVVGVLQYGPAEGPARRLVVRITDGNGATYRFRRLRISGDGRFLGNQEFQLWGAAGSRDPTSISDFAIDIDFLGPADAVGPGTPGSLRVSVPIREDAWDLEGIMLPGGWVAGEAVQHAAAPSN